MRNRWRFACLLVAAASLTIAAAAQQVMTESGTISGVRARWLERLQRRSIRRPAGGRLALAPTAAAASWTGMRKADAFAPACMQVGVSMPGETPPAVSEDCLYLNIWTPAKSAA